jgi:DNA-binding transcriptional ArsR family regulator
MTYQAGAPRYLPLDELLEEPRVRVLRLLRHFDSASLPELLDAAREPATWNSPPYQAFSRALLRHVEAGHVERFGQQQRYRYRVTASGRRELARLLAKGEVTEQRTH